MSGNTEKVKYFILVCTAICVITLLCGNNNGKIGVLEVSTVTDDVYSDSDSEVSVDPFGYFNGEWNLWEYIGDSVSSFFE